MIDPRMSLLSVYVILFSFICAGIAQDTNEATEACPVVLPTGSSAPDRIVNGTFATGDLEKYMAYIYKDGGGRICGATLLSSVWALTAAQCSHATRPGVDYLMVGGTAEGQGVRVDIADSIPHPLYNSEKFEYDIQVIRLAEAVPPRSNFVLVNSEPAIPANLAFVRTAGYGDKESDGQLLQVDIPVQPFEVCNASTTIEILQDMHICAGYDAGGCDSCKGDGGGPLYLFDSQGEIVQVGLVSFGAGCGQPGIPAGYTRLSSYTNWMKDAGALFTTSSSGLNVFASPTPSASRGVSPPPAPSASGSVGPGTMSPTPGNILSPLPSFSPAPSQSEQSTSTACFSSRMQVQLENDTFKQMQELEVGDRVYVGHAVFSDVFMFTHRVPSGMYTFMYLYSAATTVPLVLSPGHFLFINGEMKAARESRVGDLLTLADGTTSAITNIIFGKEVGLYNPQTVDGRIVVNGIIASTYTTAISPGTAHALLTPLRYLFQLSGSMDASLGTFEKGRAFGKWLI